MRVTIDLLEYEVRAIMNLKCDSKLCLFNGPTKPMTESYCHCIATPTSAEQVMMHNIIKKIHDQLTGKALTGT